MPVYDTFSKRRKGRPSKLVYDAVPLPLRQQIRMVFEDAFGQWSEAWQNFEDIIEREHPVPTFVRGFSGRHSQAYPYPIQCVLAGDLDECVDATEIGLKFLNIVVRQQPDHHVHIYSVKVSVDDAVAEVNDRFLEHGVGYQFSVDENQIIRLDSELLHAEAVEPAIRLLNSPGFEGPAEEFAKAHAYHRAGEGKDAVSWAVKALESTAKAICDLRGWKYQKTDAIKTLLDILFTNGLIPQDLESHFGGLKSALVSGLPTIGNRLTRHGQGATVKPIADHIVAFGMHLGAAAIVFLVGAHQAKP
jgi:hypothetical protein